jgi:hypothetical protein
MMRQTERHAHAGRGLWDSPWPWLAGSAAGSLIAAVWLLWLGDFATPLRVILLFISLLACGAAIVIRPGSPAVLGAATGIGVLGWLSVDPWDSARFLMVFLTALAAAASLVMLLPRVLRRVVVSGLIVCHFVAILSTVFSVPPAPWLASTLWAYAARPYLEFMYLNNAYHFYSPDPGPPNLLWFRLEYADGSRRWYKMPNAREHSTSVNYQRRLSLTEWTQHPKATDPREMAVRQHLRHSVADKYPFHPGLPEAVQFREPNANSKRVLQNYARFVAQTNPGGDASQVVVRIRVYRVVHDILDARLLAEGEDPLDLWTYRPYYQGEYDANGNLLNPVDPLLYWMVPIIKRDDRINFSPPDLSALRTLSDPVRDRTYQVYDYFWIHAGDYW